MTIQFTGRTSDDPDRMLKMEDLYREDTRPVPKVFTERSWREDIGTRPVSKEPYVSHEYAQLEMDRLWMRVWQMACREREIPNPGDFIEYEIGDQSTLVIRQRDGSIKAVANACIHRGTKLKSGSGNVDALRCPFHSWRYDLDGTLTEVPCRWDFPGLGDRRHGLSAIRVDTWQGFVFVNFDDKAEPLSEFVGPELTRHFGEFPLQNRVKVGHVGKWVNANWKNAIDAFIESYHPFSTHPQVMMHAADCSAQCDLYDLHSRFITPLAVPSPHIDAVVEPRDIIESQLHGEMVAGLKGEGGKDWIEEELAAGKSARVIMAEYARRTMQARNGLDYSHRSDSEMLDGALYFMFPNLVPWLGEGFPIVYRARPRQDLHPDWSLFEVMYLAAFPEGADTPADVPMRVLGPDEPWSEAADQLGAMSTILDQDVPNMTGQTAGIKNRRFERLMYSNDLEGLCRHFQRNVERYVGR